MTRNNMLKLINNNKGWNLIEVIVAATILVIGLFPLINLFQGLIEGMSDRKKIFQATIIAQNIMEIIKQKKWDEHSTTPLTYLADSNKTDPSLLGPEVDDIYPNFDDIDDFNNFTFTQAPYTNSHITVSYVTVNLDSTVTPSSTKTDFKEITVTTSVSTTSNRTIVIKTIKSNTM